MLYNFYVRQKLSDYSYHFMLRIFTWNIQSRRLSVPSTSTNRIAKKQILLIQVLKYKNKGGSIQYFKTKY